MDRRSFLTSMAGGTALGLRGAGGLARLRAAAATANITPALGVSLSGTIMQIGPATHVHDELHARCLALDDGVTRLAIVQHYTGLPLDRMLMAATHSHSVPRVIGISDAQLDKEYERFLTRRIADCVRMALQNLTSARIGWGSGSKPEMVSNRRWFMKPAGPVDPEVFVVSVQHADGRPLALLAPGRMDPPFVGIMSNGTCGDVTAAVAQPGSPPAPRYSRMREVAFELAGVADRVASRITHREDVRLAMRESELELGVRKPDEGRLSWAREMWTKAQGKHKLTRPEIYAREAILLSRFPGTVKTRLQALSVGALSSSPKPGSPSRMTARRSRCSPSNWPMDTTATFPRPNSTSGADTKPGPRVRAEVLRLLRKLREGVR